MTYQAVGRDPLSNRHGMRARLLHAVLPGATWRGLFDESGSSEKHDPTFQPGDIVTSEGFRKEAGRLLKECDRLMLSNPLAGKSALVLGFDTCALPALRLDLRELGVTPVISCQNVMQLEDISEMRFRADFLILNFDMFVDVEDGVIALMEFRARHRNVAVVIISRSVAGDDIGTERKAICDATLRAPLSFDRLRNGLLSALDNMVGYVSHPGR